MNWFLAKLVFSIHQSSSIGTQFDEQMRLIEAKDKLEALMKARMIGIQEEHQFHNKDSVEVSWDFIDVIELRTIHQFEDGMELSSRIEEHEITDNYVDYVKHRGQILINEIERSSIQVGANV